MSAQRRRAEDRGTEKFIDNIIELAKLIGVPQKDIDEMYQCRELSARIRAAGVEEEYGHRALKKFGEPGTAKTSDLLQLADEIIAEKNAGNRPADTEHASTWNERMKAVENGEKVTITLIKTGDEAFTGMVETSNRELSKFAKALIGTLPNLFEGGADVEHYTLHG